MVLLKKLCAADGISGDEKDIRDIILSEIDGYADVKTDNLGNIIAFKKGRRRAVGKLMISAHMDEVGFIVTDITDGGLIKFDEVGGIDRRVLPGRNVVINRKVNGVIGVKPVHLCDKDEQTKIPSYSDMYIDIGAESREEAEKYVSVGDSVAFKSVYRENDDGIFSKALDDRVGCRIMIDMIKSELEYDAFFAFVVQEEVGLHGAKAAAFTVAPDYSIVLESTTAADVPDVARTKQVCNVGEGAVIGYMDRRTIYDRGLIEKCRELSEKHGIPMQFKRAVAGGNDAGAIHDSRGGVRTIAVSLPCRYLHAQLSYISKKDYNSVSRLAIELAREIAGGNV